MCSQETIIQGQVMYNTAVNKKHFLIDPQGDLSFPSLHSGGLIRMMIHILTHILCEECYKKPITFVLRNYWLYHKLFL